MEQVKLAASNVQTYPMFWSGILCTTDEMLRLFVLFKIEYNELWVSYVNLTARSKSRITYCFLCDIKVAFNK